MTATLLVAESVTVNTALTAAVLPSVTVRSEILSVGTVSSFVIVPVAVPCPIVAFVGLLRRTVNVSFGSVAVSPTTATLMGRLVVPGLNVSVPEAAV